MYIIKRFGERVRTPSLQRQYRTYEAARSALRKHIRANQGSLKSVTYIDYGNVLYRNPSHTAYGYRIVKVVK